MWRLVVVDSAKIGDRGYSMTGQMEADGEPQSGACRVTLPGGETVTGEVITFERFAIPKWWKLRAGVLMREQLPHGSLVEGPY